MRDIKDMMIEAAADRWIAGLRDDTARTARKLADINLVLSRNRNFSGYFYRALDDENGGLCAAIRLAAENANDPALKTLGLALGYHALTCGVKKLAATREETGIPMPAAVTVNLCGSADAFIGAGEAEGIRLYFLRAYGREDEARSLASLHPESAFGVLCGCGEVSEGELCPNNAVYFLPANEEGFETAAGRLKSEGKIWVAALEASRSCGSQQEIEQRLSRSGCPFLFLLGDDDGAAPCGEKTAARRRKSCGGAYVCDFERGLLRLNRAVSGRELTAELESDGVLLVKTGGRTLSLHRQDGRLRDTFSLLGLH